MRRILILVAVWLIFGLTIPNAAYAQPALDDTTAVLDTSVLGEAPTDALEETPEVVDPLLGDPTDVEDIVEGVSYAISEWKNVGWLAGVTALINVLILLFRFPLVNTALSNLNAKWAKPLIAAILGAAIGGFSAALAGGTPGVAVVAGILAGLSSVGLHQLIDQFRRRNE